MRSEWKVSTRRACSTLRIDRALYVYKSKRGDQAALKSRIKEICETRVRYGYRRVHVLLQRDGWAINVKRVYRLYRELGLQLRNKTPKRRVKAKLREDRSPRWMNGFLQQTSKKGRCFARRAGGDTLAVAIYAKRQSLGCEGARPADRGLMPNITPLIHCGRWRLALPHVG